MPSRYVLCALLLLISAAQSMDYHPTTNLLKATPGSWTRRYAPHNHTYTEHVLDNSGGSVTVQLVRHHEGHVQENRIVTLSHDAIRRDGIDPRADGSVADEVSHGGATYAVRVIEAPLDESPGRFYITDAIPVTGIIRLDIVHPSGSVTTLWTDDYGTQPDELLRNTPPPEVDDPLNR